MKKDMIFTGAGTALVTPFTPAGETRVEDRITVEGQAIGDLFAMTPYYWKTPAEGSARLARLERLETPIGFRFLLYDRQD